MSAFRNVKLAGAVAIALACSQLCLAASEVTESGRTQKVSTADLDLSGPAGVATLYERIRAAAVAVCREEAREFRREMKAFVSQAWQDSCVASAVDGAVASAGHERLTALHRGSSERMARL
jgi:UrcA family protein